MNLQSLTLPELIRLSFSSPVTWLSVEASSSPPVQWVAGSLTELNPGDLLVLPAAGCSPQVLAEAQGNGAAAVLLLGEAALPPGDLPEGLPVAVLPDFVDSRLVQRRLLTALINQRTALMERGVRIHAQLSQMAAEGEGLAGLARAMSEIAGRGVVVQDKRLLILAECPSSTLASVWESVMMQVTSTDSLSESLRDRKRAGSQSVIVQQEVPGGLARLVAPINVGGMARGYLSLVGLAGELDALDYLVAEQGSLVCAVEMARTKAVREAEKRMKGDLLIALLQDDLSPRDAELWAQSMGLDLSQGYAALRLSWDAVSTPSRRRLETIINGEVIRRSLGAIVNPMGSEVICFCEVPPVNGRPEAALELGEAVVAQAAQEFPAAPVRCGVGTPALDLNAWRVSFRQAGQALELARRLEEREPLYFPDLSIYRLLFQIEHNPELVAFQEEILGPLLANEAGRELIHTLEAYFEHHGNLSQTAEALYIHRNTLIYRMERIAEITGLDLNKPETRLSVQLALHIQRMRGRKSTG